MGRKLTKEEINAALAPRGIQIIGEYKGIRSKALFRGACGHEWEVTAGGVIKLGSGCPFCTGRNGHSKDTVNAVLAPCGIRMISEYKNSKAIATFKGECGHEWTARVSAVKSGKSGCPTCAGRGKTRADINRVLAPSGFKLLEDFERVRDKHLFECPNGHRVRAVVQRVYRGGGCHICAGQFTPEWEEIAPEFAAKGIELIGEYVAISTRARFKCNPCGHEWTTTPQKIRTRTGCPRCAGNLAYTKEQVNTLLAPREIRLVGEWVNARAKSQFYAACGHTWRAVPFEVIHGTGCPRCAIGGTHSNPVGYVYVMEDQSGLIKIGVSNRPAFRAKVLSRRSGRSLAFIAAYQFGDGTGRAAWEAEQAAHDYFDDRHAGLTGFDGATELFRITPAEACDYLRRAGGRVVELEEAKA